MVVQRLGDDWEATTFVLSFGWGGCCLPRAGAGAPTDNE